jgi:hypothetical protein
MSSLISCVNLDHPQIGSLPNATFNEELPKAGPTGVQVPGLKNKVYEQQGHLILTMCMLFTKMATRTLMNVAKTLLFL